MLSLHCQCTQVCSLRLLADLPAVRQDPLFPSWQQAPSCASRWVCSKLLWSMAQQSQADVCHACLRVAVVCIRILDQACCVPVLQLAPHRGCAVHSLVLGRAARCWRRSANKSPPSRPAAAPTDKVHPALLNVATNGALLHTICRNMQQLDALPRARFTSKCCSTLQFFALVGSCDTICTRVHAHITS